MLISKRSVPVLIVTCWFLRTKYSKKWSISTFRETYINWNWLDQAWGRFCDALYEMNVFVRDEKDRRVSLKMLLKLASKCWFDDWNEICLCASFVCWPKMFLVLHLLRSFTKIFVWTSPGAFEILKVDVLNLLTSPGAFEILCQVFFFSFLSWLTPLKLTLKKNELCRIFLLPDNWLKFDDEKK